MELAENTTPAEAEAGYLTVAEFAAKLRVKPATIYVAIESGEIEGVIRVGSRRGLRIPRASYGAFVESRRITATNQINTGQLVPADATAA